MKLVVLGASGGVGKHAVQQAVARGHDVVAVVRASTPYEAPPGVTVVRTGLDNLSDVFAGRDAIVSCLGLKRVNAKNPFSALNGPPDFNSASAKLVVAAMKSAGVKRVVAVSAAGVGDSAPRMNWIMKFLVAKSNVGVAYRDLDVMEQVYAASGLEWCCVRPTRLTDGPLTKQVRVTDSFPSTSKIARADVAHDMLDRVERPDAGGVRLPQIEA